MIDSITRITLNLQETNTMVSIRAKRGDTGRKLLIHLSDGSIPYHISDDCYATFTAKKPDGTKINNPCTIENNVIEYEFTEQTCTAVGNMKAEIRLYGADDKMITSACFLINVYDTVFRDGDEVGSETEMNTLDDLILRANAFLNETGKLLRWQGNWDSETEYESNDLVLHEEVLYVAEEAIAAGTVPGSEGAAWVPIAGMGTGSGADLTEQVDRAEAAAQNAESAAATANNARAQAQAAANSAGVYVGNAVAAMNNANAAAATAEAAKESVSTSVNLAGGYASTAHSSANQAEQAKNSAQGYASSASSSATRAEEAAARAEEAAAEAGNGSGGNVDQEQITAAVNEALAEAKASGEFDGKDGVDGKDGQPGKDGVDGKDGYTPVKGVDYFDGKDGQDGSPGTPGADGITPHVGSNGNWFIGEADTGIPATGPAGGQGLPGTPGEDGQDGSPGKDGVTPHIGSNGNWYIGDTDTGKPSRGADGQPGQDGSPGKDGSPGSAGKDGTSVTVKSVSESTADGGSNIVTFSDGKTVTIKNGSKGSTGATGKTSYQYAQDGGYTGTEAEFAEKLANEYNPNPLYGKKVSFLGDSICAGDNANGTLGGYGKIIADRNSMVYENVARGGATVTAETYSSSTGNAKPWLCRMVDSMSADADYAIIEGGVNDAWQLKDYGNLTIGKISTGYDAVLDDTTYYGAFESMLKKLITRFKGKKIGYIAIPKTMELFDSNQNAPNFYHIAMECCAKWGVSVCDLNTITPPAECLGTQYVADGTHPTYEGYMKYYCDPIEAWMQTLTTGASIGQADADFVKKTDIQIKKAQLTLEDGTTVLIDVVVASDGTTIPKYINQVPLSVDTDKSIYNSVGYITGYRLNSSGVTKAQDQAVTTGFIPAKSGDVVRIGGAYQWLESSSGGSHYLCAYDANFAYIGGVTCNKDQYGATKIFTSVGGDATVAEVTLADVANIAYVRVSVHSASKTVPVDGSKVIVTINQEITA